MITGYVSELQARQTEMEISKLELEGLYMKPETDEAIEASEQLKTEFDTAISKVDTHMTSLVGTIKSVKLAIDPCLIFSKHPNTIPFDNQVGSSTSSSKN